MIYDKCRVLNDVIKTSNEDVIFTVTVYTAAHDYEFEEL